MSKVGDTLTVTVEPEDSKVVYQWYADGEAIEGATDDELLVTIDMIGSKISVAVADAKGNKDVSDETAPVAVYEELEILSADQTGAKTVALTFSDDISVLDKITVFKGNNEVKVDDITYDDASAVITLADKIVADAEYTVTLTPANDDPATSATFIGEKAELTEIRFLNKVLVVKDQNYKEAYAYAKGYDQYGGEVTLSGITVTPGVGSFKSYDNSTGKITLVDNNNNAANGTGAFMLIKEVPVFIQYQAGNKMISASEVLTVSTQAFVDEVVFEDEIGKDGTKRSDERLTLAELGSGKYYVAFETIKDQYGNELSADDLNYQKDTTKATGATLFIIPSNGSGAFYTTGDFGELNGKTILWLRSLGNNNKPGTMNLTITGAGGKTFSKEITVEDNPYIQTLNVSWPELYSGSQESAALEFSAIDQYGEEIDLWDFAPAINGTGKELTFTDNNRMTTQSTKITISQGKFNTVVKDAGKKTFKVTVDESGVASKTLEVFTVTTAGMEVYTQQLTVGEMGTAAKIKSALSGGNTQLDQTRNLTGKNTELNFNKFIQFEDANGNTMVRGKSEKYPSYVAINGANIEETLPVSTAAVWTADTSSFRWSLTKTKVSDTNGATVTKTNAVDYTNGVVESGDIGATNTLDVYATVYLFNGTSTYYKLDDQVFHLTKVAGTKDVSYSVKAGGTLYDNADSGNEVEIKVSATTNSGETYDVDASRIQVTPKAPFQVGSSTNKINGKAASALGSGTTTATVYVDGEQKATVDVPYSTDAPKATKVKLKFAIPDIPAGNVGNTGSEKSRVGKKFDGDLALDSFKLAQNATMSISGGKLTIEGANDLGDTITAYVEDQYGQAMSNTVFYVDGAKVTKDTQVNTSGKDVTIEYTNGTLAGRFILEKGGANVLLTYPQTLTRTVSNRTSLQAALGDSAVDTIIIDYDEADLNTAINAVFAAPNQNTIPAGKTVKINSGKKVKTTTDLKNNGTLEINGTLEMQTADDLINKGKITVNGDLISGDDITNDSAEIVVNGFWDIAYNDGGTISNVSGSVTGSGHVTIETKTGQTAITINNSNGGVASAELGSWIVTGTSTAITGTGVVTVSEGTLGGHASVANGATLIISNATLSGEVTVGGTLTLGEASKPATLANGLIIDATKATAVTTPADKAVLAAESTVTLLTKDGSTKTITTDSTTTASDVEITANTITSSTADVKSSERSMAALQLTTKGDTDNNGELNSEENLKDTFKTMGTLTRDAGTLSEDGKTLTYNYTYSGVLAYGVSTEANKELQYNTEEIKYVMPLLIPSNTEAGSTKIVCGDNLTKGTVTPESGKMTLTSSAYPNLIVYAPGFGTAKDRTFNVTYVFEDGTQVKHNITLTEANFEASAAAKG